MVEHIVIVAGGKNTRFNEMSIFPKILLPYENYGSILSYTLDLLNRVRSKAKIHLVINHQYEKMVHDYIKTNHLDVNVIVSFNTEGSANTLAEIQSCLPNENILLLWSDLILDHNGILGILNTAFNQAPYQNSNYFIFSRYGEYRYLITGNSQISKVKNGEPGNVPGIYFCKKLEPIIVDKINKQGQNYDFLEYIAQDPSKIFHIPLSGNIVEFRDLPTYLKYFMKLKPESSKTRFFNSGKIIDGDYFKRCSHPDFVHLLDKEIEWYKKASDKGLKVIPKIIETCNEGSYHFIRMEYLKDYVPVYKYIQEISLKKTLELEEESDKDFNEFLDNYVNAVKELHGSEKKEVRKDDLCQDCEKEFYKKVLDRCDSISGILYRYDREELKDLLDKATKYIIDHVMDKNYPYGVYWFTHGDLNGSNVMYNKKTKEFKFIDPRGYFGETKMIGLKEYDYAKILYCLSGYDDFNNGHQLYTKEWKQGIRSLVEYDWIENKEINNPVTRLMVAIIWIALAQYIAQDVFKANIAYDHGMYLLRSELFKLKL